MKAAAALAVGVALTVLAFPPLGVWPLALVMLAPLAAVSDGSRPHRAFAATWLYSVTMAATIVRWLLHALLVEYEVPRLPAATFLALLVGAYALLPSSAVALYALLARRSSAVLAPLLFASLYVLAEWLRAEPLALPWVLAGQPLVQAPILLQSAEWGGVYAPGFVVVAVGAGVGIAARRRSFAPLVLPAALLVTLLAWGAVRMAVPFETGPELRVGVVQASVPQSERFRADSTRRNLERHAELTRLLAARGPLDLIVWSETAVDADLDATPGLARALRTVAAESGTLLLTGAPRSAEGRRTNSVVSFDARGLRTSYDKQLLVPFSESDPELVGFVAPLLGAVTEGDAYLPGASAVVFDGAAIPFSTPVCFEITYPELVRGFRNAGAQLLVNVSNDAWFGRTGYAELHFAHAVLRAIELRTWVVRGANTGISAVIDPAGRVVERLGLFEVGTLTATVRAAAPPTLYARHGSLPVVLALAAVAFVAGSGAFRGRRAGRLPRLLR
jgi:apolipoprotein N-acyltransferase